MSSYQGPSFRRRTGFLLATVGRRTEATWGGFLRARSLTNAEFAAMAVLSDEAMTQRDLAAHLAVDPRNTGAVVRRLTERGWAAASPHPTDARSRILALSDSGQTAWSDLQRELSGLSGSYLGALDEEEQRELERLLNKLNDAHTPPRT